MPRTSHRHHLVMLTVTAALAAGAAMLPASAFAATPHTGTVAVQPSKRGHGHHPGGRAPTGDRHRPGAGAGCGSCGAPAGGTPGGTSEAGGTAGGNTEGGVPITGTPGDNTEGGVPITGGT
ncbi:hypothetical protein KBP30_28510 [Streptomyces sp. Go40/10]|uniref:hypothetical protein n=1 Tax=Streptomyces sp. Go40/10 TaxID=2825844 RepID=UPI001E36AD64|nr:hypothetical protein [Streptomyces sp. Go40/10]UFR07660.1 hypothetical protein KBP30_28510 [Streptomyces sp. Go40/10]